MLVPKKGFRAHRTASKPRRRRRDLHRRLVPCEPLEPRLLLSTTPISAGDKGALLQHLPDLSVFASSIERLPDLARERQILGHSVSNAVDFSSLLDTFIVEPLADSTTGYLDPNNLSQTPGDLAEFLSQSSLPATGGCSAFQVLAAGGSHDGGELVFDVSFSSCRRVDYSLDLGPGTVADNRRAV